MKSKKQQQQIILLVAVLVVTVITIGFFFRDRFLPKPVGTKAVLTAPSRLVIPPAAGTRDPLYDRSDFQSLRARPETSVRPLQLNGAGSPFSTGSR